MKDEAPQGGFFQKASGYLSQAFKSQKGDAEPEVQYGNKQQGEKKVKDLEARDQTTEKASHVVNTLLGVYKKRVCTAPTRAHLPSGETRPYPQLLRTFKPSRGPGCSHFHCTRGFTPG